MRVCFSSGFNLAIEMLFMSGNMSARTSLNAFCFNLAIERLFRSGLAGAPAHLLADSNFMGFNLAIERLFRSGLRMPHRSNPRRLYVSISQSRGFSGQDERARPRDSVKPVSISQSRCFSCQGKKPNNARRCSCSRFNLAIERLFSSGSHRGGCNR